MESRSNKKLIFLWCLWFLNLNLSVEGKDYPIIFIHGHEDNGTSSAGWKTWNHPYSAMSKILTEHYDDYWWGLTSTGGLAAYCDKNTHLQSVSDKKRIYVFLIMMGIQV